MIAAALRALCLTKCISRFGISLPMPSISLIAPSEAIFDLPSLSEDISVNKLAIKEISHVISNVIHPNRVDPLSCSTLNDDRRVISGVSLLNLRRNLVESPSLGEIRYDKSRGLAAVYCINNKAN